MKLFTRYFRINLVATLLIFLLASIAFYFLLWYVMIAQVDEDLKIEQREIETYLNKYLRLPDPVTVKDQRISYERTDIRELQRSFRTIPSFDAHEHDDFREISFTLADGDHWLLVRVSKSLEGMRTMNRSIISISLLTIILILLVSLLINRWLIRHLWRPFYDTLSGIKKYRLGEHKNPDFPNSRIDEFNLLNNTLDQFIAGAEKEYTLLREFTENASHELQTPLAVVRSKLDTLIQDEHLSEAQSRAAQSAYEAIQKMARLNQSLLLLSKIENRQFSETGLVDLKKAIEAKIADWQELWQAQSVAVHAELKPGSVIMNPQLADILLNNLFSNATRHTPRGGVISMQLQEKSFSMSNTAAGSSLDTGKLFQRFSKGGQATDQYGLGLSIIRQIAEVSGHQVDYRFANGLHIFTIS